MARERVSGCGLAGVSEEEAGADRAAGAGNPGEERHRLGQAEQDGVPGGQLLQWAPVGADPVGHAEDDPEHDEGERDHAQVAQRGFDGVLEQCTEHGDGDAADDDVPAQAGAWVRAQLRGAQRPGPRADDVRDVAAEVDSTAVSVPSWVTAVNAAPGSGQPARTATTRRCADEEMGRNSVSPCTVPRTRAASHVIVDDESGRRGRPPVLPAREAAWST